MKKASTTFRVLVCVEVLAFLFGLQDRRAAIVAALLLVATILLGMSLCGDNKPSGRDPRDFTPGGPP